MEGRIINGYIVKRFLGQGTFGNTWLVQKGEKFYALKLFKNEMIRDSQDEVRIEREIKSLQKVNHKNVVRYIDDGIYIQGYEKYRYLVMEYAQGEPLRNYIQAKGRLTITESQRIITQVLEGLNAIHNAGLLHRDLKPDNIFITRLGEVQILDFGLVKILDASILTATGATMGTFAYMAPEQLKDSKHIDYRADLYSIGAILYHMVTGVIPIEINSIIEAPYKILNVTPKSASTLNPAVPKKIDYILANLLEKEAYWRKYTIASLLNDLNNLEDKSLVEQNQKLKLQLLPRILHNERTFIEEYVGRYGIDGIVFQANFLSKYHGVYDYVKSKGGQTYIDPVVYRLAYSKFTSTKSIVDLPYVLSGYTKEKPDDFESIKLCAERAKKVIDWQNKYGTEALIAPFHYAHDVNDPWIERDLVVFNECRKYLNSIKCHKPLYAGISIQMESISDESNAVRLVNLYTRIQPDGYILMFDIDLESANKAHYYWFTKFIHMLSVESKPIILFRVNDFGLGLTSFGVTAISSGLGYIKSFKETFLIDDNKGYNIKPNYYIPELLTCYNEKDLEVIFEPASSKTYICHCPYCKGSMEAKYLLQSDVAKGHYLYKKQEQIKMLNEMGFEERYRWFETQLTQAIAALKVIKKTTRSNRIQYKHLEAWLDTFRIIHNEIEIASRSTIRPIV